MRKQKRIHSHTYAQRHTHKQTRAHTDTHKHTHTNTHTLQTHINALTCMHTHTNTRAKTHIHICCSFGPRKASKVEKPSSRGVSSLHRWSLMLLPVLWLMPLRSLHTCMCVCYSESTQLSVVATLLLLLRSWDPWSSDGPLGLNVVTY